MHSIALFPVVAINWCFSVASADLLVSQLESAIFMNSGVVKSSYNFTYVPMSVSYNEPDNVTCSMCGWAVHSPWYYEWMEVQPAPGPSPMQQCVDSVQIIAHNQDSMGADLQVIQTESATTCATACCNLAGCNGFLFENASDIACAGSPAGGVCCWLKSAIKLSGRKPPSVGAAVGTVLYSPKTKAV